MFCLVVPHAVGRSNGRVPAVQCLFRSRTFKASLFKKLLLISMSHHVQASGIPSRVLPKSGVTKLPLPPMPDVLTSIFHWKKERL